VNPDAAATSVDPTHVPLLEVIGLTTTFITDDGDVVAGQDISLRLDKGQTLGVVGESGSGKSVLSRAIMGILYQGPNLRREGVIRFDGQDLRDAPRSASRSLWGKDIAMVLQDPLTSLNPVTKIGRQVIETVRRHNSSLTRAEARQRAVELLRLVGIPEPEGRMDVYAHQLSGGMRQRVGIAIALAGNPRLLFADEPTTALDVTVQRQILDLLGKLQRELDMAMVLVTHDMGVVATRTDHIMVMYAGRVVESAPTKTLFADIRMPYTRGLLDALPDIDQPSHMRLKAIPGHPPSLANPGTGCRFASRCLAADDHCRTEEPPLVAVPEDPAHLYRCWKPVGSAAYEAALVASNEMEGTFA
jgi:oligopeptide/dipeptide ABC transporter ATP-binding protein